MKCLIKLMTVPYHFEQRAGAIFGQVGFNGTRFDIKKALFLMMERNGAFFSLFWISSVCASGSGFGASTPSTSTR